MRRKARSSQTKPKHGVDACLLDLHIWNTLLPLREWIETEAAIFTQHISSTTLSPRGHDQTPRSIAAPVSESRPLGSVASEDVGFFQLMREFLCEREGRTHKVQITALDRLRSCTSEARSVRFGRIATNTTNSRMSACGYKPKSRRG